MLESCRYHDKRFKWIDSVDARCYHFSRYLLSLALHKARQEVAG